MPVCCVCGKQLPNKYAIAARCSEPGCEAVFCTLHAATWNKRCPDHGGSETSPLHADAGDVGFGPSTPAEPALDGGEAALRPTPEKSMNDSEENLVRDAKAKLPSSRMRGILASVGEFAARAGRLAGDLVRRIRNEKDPEEMLKSLDASLAANREKRQPIFDRNAALAAEIGAKKKAYEAAPPARRKMLELELRNLLAEYKANERQLTAFFENENALTVVRGRLLEQIALGMQTLKEDDIDKLADDIEEAVSDAENISDAVRDLDKAGRRRERDGDADSFADELAAFDTPSAAENPAAAFESPAAAAVGSLSETAESAPSVAIPETPAEA